jgi:23S rRNA pseudouridine1911/1915/1917 synthase
MISNVITYRVSEEEAVLRLDILTSNIIKRNRSYVKKLFDNGKVLLNGKQVKTGYKPAVNDLIEITIPEVKDLDLVPNEVDLEIVYEDKDIVVVNKPPFMAVHPGLGGAHEKDSLVNALLHHCRDLTGINDTLRPGIVHRLDKNTSGLIVVAKNQNSNEEMVNMFKSRSIKKQYIALVSGNLRPKSAMIDSPIGRSRGDRKKMSVVDENKGKEAKTKFVVKEYLGDYSLVDVYPLTGRTHQIRVHLASIGFPIVGDELYGNYKVNKNIDKISGLKRQFLHAYKLEFDHPVTKKHLCLEAPLTADLVETLKVLRE